jgi:hypothetical protein
MRIHFLALAMAGSLLTTTVRADPGDVHPKLDRPTRAGILEKIRTGFIVELGSMLDLDTTATIKLSGKLKPFDDRRMKLRLDTWDATEQLKQAAHGGAADNVGELARKIARNRVELAKIDQEELDELLKDIPADKRAKAAVFLLEYPKRIEQIARQIIHEHMSPDGSDHDHGASKSE